MSIFNSANAKCSSCGHQQEVSWAASVNAGRRPDLREAILDRSFQGEACESCGAKLRLPPHLTYIDVPRRTWVLVQGFDEIGQWISHEAEAQQLFDETFGAGAPPAVREIAEGVSPRLVFGWPPLREKIVAQALGLDDVTLELLKLAILRNVPGGPVGGVALRLVEGDDSTLRFEVTDDETEAVSAETEVPRDLYDDIAGDPAPWAALRERLEGKALVDLLRFTLEG